MADVDARALLRAERVTRRITHPQASYTKDGKLLCNLCELPIKSENAWKTHLHSTGHVLRQTRAHDADVTRKNGDGQGGAKKRKADSLDSPIREERKKARPAKPEEEPAGNAQEQSAPSRSVVPVVESVVVADDQVLDDEYAAFEREMAQLDSTSTAPSALTAAATISATPLSVADIAAQAREEQSAQRGKRDVEIEGEREDAARLMADELDEMDELEERVKKLRKRRDALRSSKGNGESQSLPREGVHPAEEVPDRPRNEDVDDDIEDEDDADFDDWQFGSG